MLPLLEVKSPFWAIEKGVSNKKLRFDRNIDRIGQKQYLMTLRAAVNIRVFRHLFKQSQTEPIALFVFQDPESKISEKWDQN